MNFRARRRMLVVGLALGFGVAFLAGRLTGPDHPTAPVVEGTATYAAGVAAGEAMGVQEGRALQEGSELPPNDRRPVQDAFNAGYSAGANDVFSGYDGGWLLGVPYVVTLRPGQGAVAYRIGSRTELRTDTIYTVCPDGHHVCTQTR